MKVTGFFSFSLGELSSWQEAWNATVLVLLMLRKSSITRGVTAFEAIKAVC